MTYTRTLVCLASSIKHYPSRCIAGKEWSATGAGNWLRPVVDYNVDEGAISLASSKFQDGSQPQILDIVQISFDRAVPHGCQVENQLINGEVWSKQGRVGWTELEAMVESYPDLWGIGNSSGNGLNDRLSHYEANQQHNSLRLIRPQNLRLVVSTTGAAFNNPKKGMRAIFNVGNNQYSLKVTDPRYTDRMRQYEEDVEYPMQNGILCVSISEPLNGYHYKLIATIFMREDF
jgi:hypothetical protein